MVHAVTAQAVEEERARRSTLLRIRSTQSEDALLSSYQYRDLLNMRLDMFGTPPAEEGLCVGEQVPAELPLHPLACEEVVEMEGDEGNE